MWTSLKLLQKFTHHYNDFQETHSNTHTKAIYTFCEATVQHLGVFVQLNMWRTELFLMKNNNNKEMTRENLPWGRRDWDQTDQSDAVWCAFPEVQCQQHSSPHCLACHKRRTQSPWSPPAWRTECLHTSTAHDSSYTTLIVVIHSTIIQTMST